VVLLTFMYVVLCCVGGGGDTVACGALTNLGGSSW
jgi:hypothetical protein